MGRGPARGHERNPDSRYDGLADESLVSERQLLEIYLLRADFVERVSPPDAASLFC